MKKLLITVGVLLVLCFSALLALPFLVSADTLKSTLLSQIEAHTGRTLKIDGPLSLSVFPTLSLQAENVALSQPSWAGKGNMITAKHVDFGVKLLPLLRREIDLTKLVLDTPEIILIKSGKQTNWEFSPSTPSEKKSSRADAADGSATSTILKIGEIAIHNGSLTYKDLGAKKTYALTDVDLDLQAEDLDSAASLDGSAVYEKRRVALNTHIDKLGALLDGTTTKANFDLKTDGVSVAWDGTMTLGKSIAAKGAIDARIDRVSDWTGNQNGPKKLSLQGDAGLEQSGTRSVIHLQQCNASVDDLDAALDLVVTLGSGVPHVAGTIRMDTLKLPQSEADAASAAGTGGTSASTNDWSDAKMDFSGLRAANANLKIAIGELVAGKTKLKPANMTLTLKDGTATIALAPSNFYEGSVTGTASASASGNVALNATLSNAQAEPMLTELADFKRLSGTVTGNLNVRSSGNTQRQLVTNANGGGALTFTDGAIRGINLAAMLRNIKSAFTTDQSASSQKTDFSELSGTFTIRSGVVHNNDLKLKSPLLRVGGEGDALLPSRTLDYTLKPQLVTSLEGQGGREDVTGLMVPVRITGTFDKPRYTPDLSGALAEGLKDPKKLEDTVKGARDSLKQIKNSDDLKNTLKGFLGGQ